MFTCRDCGQSANDLDHIMEDHECIYCGGEVAGYDPDEYDREQKESQAHEQADDRRKYDYLEDNNE